MKGMKKATVFIIILFFTNVLSAVTDGNLDLNFNNNGVVFTDFGSNAGITAVAVQADGKIVAAGYSQESGQNVFAIFRYNSDGSHDASFGSNGKIITRFGRGENASGAQAVILQPDGKILAGGFTNAFRNTFRWCLARYNADGSLDNSFMSGYATLPGTVITPFGTGDDVSQLNDLAIQSDGKIVAAGISFTRPHGIQFAIARYNVDGTLDTVGFNPNAQGSLAGTVRLSLGTNGSQHDEAHAIAIQPNGKIVIAGCSFASGVKTFALARLQPNGVLDNSFYSGGLATIPGTVITSFACGETDGGAYALIIQPDEKIVAAGYTNSNVYQSSATRIALARYDAQGRLDASFGGNGLATIAGTVISSFGVGEKASRINGLTLQADGKLVVVGSSLNAGNTYGAIARYNVDGSMDASFNRTTLLNNELLACALQTDGSLLGVGIANTNSLINGFISRYVSANTSLALPTISQPADNFLTIDGSAIQVQGSAQNPGLVSVLVNGKVVDNIYVHGAANQWATILPNLGEGNYQIIAREQYNAGRVTVAGSPVNISVDLNPKGIDAAVTTCANASVSGILQAAGASGNYQYAILSATNGSVVLDGMTYSFTPSVSSGAGSFIFQVTDAVTNGTGTGTVTIAINELPVAPSVALSICQDNPLNGNLNDSVSGIVAPYQFAQIGSALNGSAVLNADGTFNFVPNAGFSGDASFQYQIIDGNGCVSEPSSVTIHVLQAPIANDGNLVALQDALLKVDLNQFVSGGVSPYNFVQIGATVNGTAGIKNNGSSLFVPTGGFVGDASFQYQVTDANNCTSNVATVTVTLNPVSTATSEIPAQVGQIPVNNTLK